MKFQLIIKTEIKKKYFFLFFKLSDVLIMQRIVKMLTIVGNLSFMTMSMINFMLSGVEHEKNITSGPDDRPQPDIS